MVDKITFMETLRSVAEITKTSNEPLSREEIQKYFENMDLSSEQQEMVYQYFLVPQEEVPEEKTEDVAENAAESYTEESLTEESQTKEQEIRTETLADSQFYKMYLEDLKELKQASAQEMQALYKELLAGDDYVIGAISDNWLLKVLEISKNYASRNVNMEDVIQEGNIGLLFGLNNLVGATDVQDVEDYLTQSIKKSMEAYIDEMMSEDDWETTMVAKVTLIHEAQKAMAEEIGRVPTVAELSQFTKIPEDEIQDILELSKETTK